MKYTTKMGEKLEGSVELKEALPYGAIKRMADVFNHKGQSYLGRVVAGLEKGNPLILECATRIADAYEETGFDEKLDEILKDYEIANKATV